MVAEASVAAALYAHQAGNNHVAGQNHQKKTIESNPGVYVEPNQPLIQVGLQFKWSFNNIFNISCYFSKLSWPRATFSLRRDVWPMPEGDWKRR